MSSETLEQNVNRVLVLQLVLTLSALLIVAGIGIIFSSEGHVVVNRLCSIGFGCGLAFVLTLISARSVRKSSETSYKSPELAMMPVYAGTVQKLLVAAAGMALGLVKLELEPAHLIIGFLLLHLAYIAAALGSSSKSNRR
ncbi:MAG: hypothetical protein AAF402_04205 [Pseudomonadota bacterium]